MTRIYNFAAGPAVLPEPVLEQASREMLDWHGSGVSVMEMKGHRAVGGMRASIYNAMPIEGVTALVEFMRDFQKKNG